MWSRADLKARGKENFQKNYWICVLVSFILMILVGGGSISRGSSIRKNFAEQSTGVGFTVTQLLVILAALTGVAIAGMIIGLIISLLVIEPLKVGARHFYLKNRVTSARVEEMAFSYQSGYLKNIILTSFLKNLFIWLWSLLLFIPGLVKIFSYWMIEYILAENPTLDYKRAFEISMQTMRGEKWNTFILQLSFILWGLLSLITAGLAGVFYVSPYVDATNAELYMILRQKALDNGIATIEELPGVRA